jgi:transcriptional regulator with XRE-family HTH domain
VDLFSLGRIPMKAVALFNPRMKTIDQIRRERLHLLRKQSGGVGKLAEKLGKSPSQVSQWINASAHSGSGKPRIIGDDAAREIEEKFNLLPGWMDTDIDRVNIADVQFLIREFFAASEDGRNFILEAAKIAEKDNP